jgi:hypothetical protein
MRGYLPLLFKFIDLDSFLRLGQKFWMAGFLVIPKVYAVIASPFITFSFSDTMFPCDDEGYYCNDNDSHYGPD